MVFVDVVDVDLGVVNVVDVVEGVVVVDVVEVVKGVVVVDVVDVVTGVVDVIDVVERGVDVDVVDVDVGVVDVEVDEGVVVVGDVVEGVVVVVDVDVEVVVVVDVDVVGVVVLVDKVVVVGLVVVVVGIDIVVVVVLVTVESTHSITSRRTNMYLLCSIICRTVTPEITCLNIASVWSDFVFCRSHTLPFIYELSLVRIVFTCFRYTFVRYHFLTMFTAIYFIRVEKIYAY